MITELHELTNLLATALYCAYGYTPIIVDNRITQDLIKNAINQFHLRLSSSIRRRR